MQLFEHFWAMKENYYILQAVKIFIVLYQVLSLFYCHFLLNFREHLFSKYTSRLSFIKSKGFIIQIHWELNKMPFTELRGAKQTN